MQQKSRVRLKELNIAINNAVDFMADVGEGVYTVDNAMLAVLDDKLGQALTVDFFWFTDYSLGFHNPALLESSVTTAVKELNTALADTRKAYSSLRNNEKPACGPVFSRRKSTFSTG